MAKTLLTTEPDTKRSRWRRLPNRPRFGIALEFKPADLWIGLYFNRSVDNDSPMLVFSTKDDPQRLDVWICAVPMLPLHLWFRWRPKGA